VVGELFRELERVTIVEQTTDPRAAVALAELLLLNWPYAYPLRHDCPTTVVRGG
jgi:hypothetical protein